MCVCSRLHFWTVCVSCVCSTLGPGTSLMPPLSQFLTSLLKNMLIQTKPLLSPLLLRFLLGRDRRRHSFITHSPDVWFSSSSLFFLFQSLFYYSKSSLSPTDFHERGRGKLSIGRSWSVPASSVFLVGSLEEMAAASTHGVSQQKAPASFNQSLVQPQLLSYTLSNNVKVSLRGRVDFLFLNDSGYKCFCFTWCSEKHPGGREQDQQQSCLTVVEKRVKMVEPSIKFYIAIPIMSHMFYLIFRRRAFILMDGSFTVWLEVCCCLRKPVSEAGQKIPALTPKRMKEAFFQMQHIEIPRIWLF